MAENWRRAEGSPPYPYWRDAATGETQNFFIFGIVAWEKATGRATEQRREDTDENDKEGYGMEPMTLQKPKIGAEEVRRAAAALREMTEQ